MVRSVFGNWEADFAAKRREKLFNCACVTTAIGVLAFALFIVWVYEAPRVTRGPSAAYSLR